MAFPRLAGIILHPTSLSGGNGIGDIGPAARSFVDFLENAGMGIWQMLPLGPTGGANSPYQAASSFAGNPLLISLAGLVELELLDVRHLANSPANTATADFQAASTFKEKAFRSAMDGFQDARADASLVRDFERFCDVNHSWLNDFALYTAAKEFNKGKPWYAWKDNGLRHHSPAAVKKYTKLLAHEIRYQKFLQFIFFRQWNELKRYAESKHVKFLGDIPIYCAHDSADVWAAPEYFHLDADGLAEFQAGVPPDYFSATGQLWGNPIYNWAALKKDSYSWWVHRLKAALAMVDMVRIDHFRGFEAFWAVPKGEKTAMHGRWILGPGQKLFDVFHRELGADLPILAEDLGVITPRVDKLRTDNGLPGMKILQFAFADGAESYLPYSYDRNTVCYVATHDNDTTLGWYEAEGPDYEHMSREALGAERDKARRFLGRDGSGIAWDLMRLALESVADTAILLMQDVLNLPNSCRMNRPGIGENQWRWRMTGDQLTHANWGGLRDMVFLYGRQPVKPVRETVEDVEAVELDNV